MAGDRTWREHGLSMRIESESDGGRHNESDGGRHNGAGIASGDDGSENQETDDDGSDSGSGDDTATGFGWVVARTTPVMVVERVVERHGVWAQITQVRADSEDGRIDPAHPVWGDLGPVDAANLERRPQVRIDRTSWVFHDGDGTVDLEFVHDVINRHDGDFHEELHVLARSASGRQCAEQFRVAGLLRPPGFSALTVDVPVTERDMTPVHLPVPEPVPEPSADPDAASPAAEIERLRAELVALGNLTSVDMQQRSTIAMASAGLCCVVRRFPTDPSGEVADELGSVRELHRSVTAALALDRLVGRSSEEWNRSVPELAGSKQAGSKQGREVRHLVEKLLAQPVTDGHRRVVRDLRQWSKVDGSGIADPVGPPLDLRAAAIDMVRADAVAWRSGKRREKSKARQFLMESLSGVERFAPGDRTGIDPARLLDLRSEELWEKILQRFVNSPQPCDAAHRRQLVYAGALLESARRRRRKHRRVLRKQIDRFLDPTEVADPTKG